jgi:hypothetical protein
MGVHAHGSGCGSAPIWRYPYSTPKERRHAIRIPQATCAHQPAQATAAQPLGPVSNLVEGNGPRRQARGECRSHPAPEAFISVIEGLGARSKGAKTCLPKTSRHLITAPRLG